MRAKQHDRPDNTCGNDEQHENLVRQHPSRRRQHPSRHRRQRRIEHLVQVVEAWQNEKHHDRQYADGEAYQHDRVDDRTDELGSDLLLLLGHGGQPLKRFGDLAGAFTGADDRPPAFIENLWITGYGRAERRAGFDLFLDLGQNGAPRGLADLRTDGFQRGYDAAAGAEHHGHLLGEQEQIVRIARTSGEQRLTIRLAGHRGHGFLGRFADARHEQTAGMQLLGGVLDAAGVDDARYLLTRYVQSIVREGHGSTPDRCHTFTGSFLSARTVCSISRWVTRSTSSNVDLPASTSIRPSSRKLRKFCELTMCWRIFSSSAP